MLAERGERLDEAVKLIHRALEVDPNNAAYLDSLGWAYFKLDRMDLAEGHLRRAAEQMTTNSVVQDHFGDLLYKLGRYREAVEAWQRALAGDGADIERTAIERKLRQAREKVRP
jgi:tetratricopeptide (TPR) repeat protein